MHKTTYFSFFSFPVIETLRATSQVAFSVDYLSVFCIKTRYIPPPRAAVWWGWASHSVLSAEQLHRPASVLQPGRRERLHGGGEPAGRLDGGGRGKQPGDPAGTLLWLLLLLWPDTEWITLILAWTFAKFMFWKYFVFSKANVKLLFDYFLFWKWVFFTIVGLFFLLFFYNYVVLFWKLFLYVKI